MAENEKEKRQPRRLVVALPEEKAGVLRRVADMTGLSQAELLAAIEGHEMFASAVEIALKERYAAWKEGIEDPFKPARREGYGEAAP